MGWDSTAIVIAEIASIEGLLRRARKPEPISEDFVKGYREATEEQIAEKYWFSDDSHKLGKVLYQNGMSEFDRFTEEIYQISQKLDTAFANKAFPESEKKTVLRECQQSLKDALEKIQVLNGGKMPFEHLEWFLNSLKDDGNSKD